MPQMLQLSAWIPNEPDRRPVLQSKQLEMFPDLPKNDGRLSSTFVDNLKLPIHRWFRYSAGFSALWAGEVIEKEHRNGRLRVLDPFSGSGTVLLEAEQAGVEALGIEAHPFVVRPLCHNGMDNSTQ